MNQQSTEAPNPIHALNEAVAQLADIADQEREAMIVQDLERMDVLLQSKQHFLVQVAQLCERDDFRDQLDRDPALRGRFRELASQFRQRNAANQAIAHVQINHARQSLMLLRSVLGLRDTTLYGNNGEMTVSKEQRNLGQA